MRISDWSSDVCSSDLFSATAAREPILSKAQVAAALAARRHRPMLLLDLAVPRDIAPDVATLKDAFLYTVDDLERAIEDNRQSRREAADSAEVIFDLQVSRYVELLAPAPRHPPPTPLPPPRALPPPDVLPARSPFF